MHQRENYQNGRGGGEGEGLVLGHSLIIIKLTCAIFYPKLAIRAPYPLPLPLQLRTKESMR